jgi:hypothetical protein
MDEHRIDLTTTATTRQAPLPASIPQPAKRASIRQSPLRVTAHVRVSGAALDDEAGYFPGRSG